MKSHQLHAFIAVSSQMSIRGAARALGVSPPAVTKIIREFEREIGAPLIERSVKGVQLTEFGVALLPRARLLLDDMQRARDEIKQLRDGASGHVRAVVSTSFAQTLLAPALMAFREQRPAVAVYFSEATLPNMLSRLREAQADFAVTHFMPEHLDEEFESLPLFPVRLVAGVRNRHPLRNQRSLGALMDAEWALPGDGSDKGFAADFFMSLGLPRPARIIQGDSVTVALALVSQMDMIGVFVEPLAQQVFKRYGIRRLELMETLPTMLAGIIYRRNSRLTPAIHQFIECIRAVSHNMLG